MAANSPRITEKSLEYYNDKGEVLLTAYVCSAPDRRKDVVIYTMCAVEIDNPFAEDWTHSAHVISGKAQVRMPLDSHYNYGDLLQFYAEPRTPSDAKDFSYKKYLSRENIHSVIYFPFNIEKVGSGKGSPLRAGLLWLRERVRLQIFNVFPQPESGLLSGILLGLDNDLPGSLTKAYRETGTSHIIAISGFNMTILAALFLKMYSKRFNRYLAVLLTLLTVGIYALFVDGSASVIRAALMSVLAFAGHSIGRKQNGHNALAFAAATMCLINPLLIEDAGFQLSAAATLGLVTFAQPLQEWAGDRLERYFPEKTAHNLAKPLSEYLLFTLAAQITTLPVLVYHFGRVSITSLFINPLIIPAQPAILVMGAVAAILGMIHPIAGKLAMLFVWPLLVYTNRIVLLFSKIKGGVLTIHPSAAIWITVTAVVLLALYFSRNFFKKILGSEKLLWLYVLLLCGCVSVWSIYIHQPNGKTRVESVNAGETEVLAIRAARGELIVIDPCGDMNELASSLSEDLSPWDYSIDSVLLTDQSCADKIEVLNERIQVKKILLLPEAARFRTGENPMLLPEGIETQELVEQKVTQIGEGITVLPIRLDGLGSALFFESNGVRILLPNGTDYAEIKELSPASLQKLDALVLAPEDVSYIPPRVWIQLNPAVLIWNSASLSPFENSVSEGVY